jgi:hypothetical protein
MWFVVDSFVEIRKFILQKKHSAPEIYFAEIPFAPKIWN